MKKISFIYLFTTLLIVACKSDNDSQIEPTKQAFDVKALRSEFITKIETPTTATFGEHVSDLNTDISNFTTTISEGNLEALKASWKQAATSFSNLEVLAIGNIKTSLIMTSFYTWQANEIAITDYIASTNPITKEAINIKSTAMRGLGAIEFLIFEAPSAETIAAFSNDERRKKYLTVLGENLVEKFTLLNSIWSEYRNDFIANNQTGINGGVNMMVNQLNVVLENVRRFKIGEPAGLEVTSSANAKLLQAEKSAYSLALIEANIASIKRVYFDTEHSLDDYVAYITTTNALNDKVMAQFNAITSNLATLSNTALKDTITTQPAEVEKLYNAIRALLVLIKADVASALSVTITFTDNDGD